MYILVATPMYSSQQTVTFLTAKIRYVITAASNNNNIILYS